MSGMDDLEKGSVRAVSLLDEDVAVWRGRNGSVRAWRNQCPHRGMRLSFAQVRGDRLSCRYHGWQFDQDGRCRFMPAHRRMSPPAAIHVSSYGCREASGLIWVRLEDDGAAFEDLVAAIGLENEALFCKSIFVDGSHESLAELLVGACFPPFSRAPRTSADGGFERSVFERERGSDESRSVVAWKHRGRDPEAVFSTRYHGTRRNRSIVRVVARTGDDPPEVLVIVLQAMTGERTGVHVLTRSGGSERTDRRKRLFFGRWARRLRWSLEFPDMPCEELRPWT